MSSPVQVPAAAVSPWILELRDLKKSYECGRIEALRGVSLNIAAGDFMAISGASGSGKSTMLHLLGGLDTPTEGSVVFRGQQVGKSQNGVPAIDLDTYRARWVGFIFQSFHLLPSLNAMENVQVPMLGNKTHTHHREARARALLVEMGLEHRLNQYPTQLSAGERQRVAIARALVNDPPLLLADEPTGNLDSVNSAKILQILAEIQARRGMTLIMVTHDESIAASARRHVVMKDGLVWK
ncbi:MAG TPA: ABC transporter ATP-binding protein [Acidobacteriaceae bacterium]|jgi:putative ABC transport system ATP-binding protein|nr:ABC transporter ATP-binding protein [Acidobacteriaceae bacterium]